MKKEELRTYITLTYGADAEFPWSRHPEYMVFRHGNNQKWFALVMDIPKEKLGLSDPGVLDILNVKCNAMMIGSFRGEPGFYPAYHMSKTSWLTVALDGSVPDETIKSLLDISFDLTARKVKKRTAPPQK